MDNDLTQHQTAEAQSASKKLSMQGTTPPAEVPGYQLQKFLGAGAFGQVWVGRDMNTGRTVAVKFCLHRGGVNWSLLSHEVKNLVQLAANRCVVQVLEVGWDADPPYYVMEWIGGGSLEDLLQARKKIPVSEAVEMFRQICVGLNHCHGKGVLHCDIKPANILLGEDDEPRLADFGQSRMTHDQTPALGTLFYMAPEQADLESTPDARWDVYAVGAILYRMLTGNAPYRHDSVIDQIDTAGSLPKRLSRYRTAIGASPPPTDHLQVRGVDRALGKIISQCLEVNPEERYANVQQIVQDLDRRENTRARRPLMVSGIIGPILLLAVTCFFMTRTIMGAGDATKKALRQEAFGSNQLAAQFAARTLESEIERYFELAQDESSRSDFLGELKQAIGDPEVSQTLTAISQAGTSSAAAKQKPQREKLLDAPGKSGLDRLLADRLKLYTQQSAGSRRPRLASIFVTDSKGTMISIAYDAPVSRQDNSTGRNYSYRTYFHGGQDDLSKETPIETITPLTETRLSAPFRSTATFLFKVAISLPIFLSEESTVPDAVFVATLNLGDFELPQSKQGANQIAVLIDAREGSKQGIVLQHPLMDARRKNDRAASDEIYRVPEDLMVDLFREGDVTYVDPLAAAPDGAMYGGEWIAAMQPVSLPRGEDATSETTDLLVLVQYKLAKVNAPVGVMQTQLLREVAALVISIFLVAFCLWYFVSHVSNTKSHSEPTPTINVTDAETIAAT